MILQNIFIRKLPKGQVVWCLGLPYTKESFLFCCRENVKSDFIDSLELQYNSMDAEILWSYYEQTAKKIKETIDFLRDRNVDVIDMNHVDNLRKAYSYSTIILTAHRHRFLECLEFYGNTISIEKIIDSIPPNFKGIFDISSCYSSTFQMKCKQKAINATYIAAETESSVELRLFIYKHTIKHLISHQQGDYLESLRVIIRRIIENSKQGKQNNNSVFLGGNKPSINKIRKGSASAFAPNVIRRGEDMMVQIYIYKDEKRKSVIYEAKKCDDGTSERSHIPLNFDINEGDKVDVSLSVINSCNIKQRKSFIWRNCVSKVCFIVSLPPDYKKEKVFVEILLSINNAIIGELLFSTSVVDKYTQERKIAEVPSRSFNKIFISYSHKDEQRVKYIAEAYRAQGVDYFFDRHYLKGGDVYPIKIREYIDSADLFILCWSKNAAESDYVTLERRQALALAYPQVDMENATITIHPISIEPHADYPEDMNEVYNFEEI